MLTGTNRRMFRPLLILLLVGALLVYSTPAHAIGVICGGCRGSAESLVLDKSGDVVFE